MYGFLTEHPIDGNVLNKYIETLAANGFIKQVSTDCLLITPKGFEHVRTDNDHLTAITDNSSNIIRDIFIGVLIAVIAGFILWILGWN